MLMSVFLLVIENIPQLQNSKFLPSFPGILLEKEISNLKKLIQVTDQSSSTAVFGGSKVSTKIKIIDFYIKKFNKSFNWGSDG